MDKNILEYSLKRLLDMSVVSGVNDYSVRFLKRNPSYARTIRSRKKDLSLGSLVILATRIQCSSQTLLESDVGKQLGKEMKMLADEINQHIYYKALLQN